MKLLASRRHALRFCLGAAAASASLPALVAPAWAADPAQLIATVSAEVIQLIKTTTGPARQVAILRVLETNFDLPYMGRTALGTHWDGTGEAMRQRFLKAAATAEARAYSERFGQYGGQTLIVGRVMNRPNGVAVVDSKLNQSNGQPIRIEWEVRDNGRGPRITDVKIEGISMIMTRRSDFNSYIQSHGGKVEALVQELETRAAR